MWAEKNKGIRTQTCSLAVEDACSDDSISADILAKEEEIGVARSCSLGFDS